jgi:hypothetical protein
VGFPRGRFSLFHSPVILLISAIYLPVSLLLFSCYLADATHEAFFASGWTYGSLPQPSWARP